jgi:phenylalanyl-tRNA synthetase beta chain
MPVIELSLNRLRARARNKFTEQEILDALPFIGLDIEERNEDLVSVEYSPNRPDFCSEAGIARSLMGLLEVEKGLPKFDFRQGQIVISVEGPEIQSVRPHIFSLYCTLNVNEEIIKQLIVMQEDLHNGLGRHRTKVAIGIHNAEMVRPPIKYFATFDKEFSFVPLNMTEKATISEIMEKTEQGMDYGKILGDGPYPLLIDSSGNTLSMPPVINGELTRLKQGVRSIFVDVTATDKRVGETTIAIIAAMLSDIGGKIETVTIKRDDGSTLVTPDMMPNTMKFDLGLTNEILGLQLATDQAKSSLEKSRLELLSQDHARIPKFRIDVMHPIDLTEDIALGYGISNLKPSRTKSYAVGSVTAKTRKIRRIVDVLLGLGLTEIESLTLTSRDEFGVNDNRNLKVDDAKSETYEYLRAEALPSLLRVLSQSIHEEYPQKVFEQVSVFRKDDTGQNISFSGETKIIEEPRLAVAIADSRANYTGIRSVLDGFLRLVTPSDHQVSFSPLMEDEEGTCVFAKGRAAKVLVLTRGRTKLNIGTIGEISPAVLSEKLKMRVPVAAFEIRLDFLLND